MFPKFSCWRRNNCICTWAEVKMTPFFCSCGCSVSRQLWNLGCGRSAARRKKILHLSVASLLVATGNRKERVDEDLPDRRTTHEGSHKWGSQQTKQNSKKLKKNKRQVQTRGTWCAVHVFTGPQAGAKYFHASDPAAKCLYFLYNKISISSAILSQSSSEF